MSSERLQAAGIVVEDEDPQISRPSHASSPEPKQRSGPRTDDRGTHSGKWLLLPSA